MTPADRRKSNVKRLFALVLAITVLIPTIGLAATQSGKLPFILVFACPLGDKPGPSERDVVGGVIERLSDFGQATVLAYSPDLKTVTRAVLEKRLTQSMIEKIDPERAAQIAVAVGADYALCVQGDTTGADINVVLEMRKLPANGRWVSSARGQIAEGTGPRAEVNRQNAIITAASAAVSQILILTFGQDAVLKASAHPVEPPPVETPTPVIAMTPDVPRDAVAEYNDAMKQVDEYAAKHDIPNVIIGLRRAINISPNEISPRVKLAGMYSDQGMTAAAVDECKRALLFKKDDVSVHRLLAKLYMKSAAFPEAAVQYAEVARLDPQDVDARLNLGDISWNQGKIDDAAKSYEESAKLAPGNPAPHERLKRLYQARKMYAKSLDEALLVGTLAGKPSDDSARYGIVVQVVRDEFKSITGKLDAAALEFEKGLVSRDDYYSEAKDIAKSIDALDAFLSKQTAPDGFKAAHAHAVLSVSLLAQAGGSVVSYLETEKRHYSEEADTLQGEAKSEMDVFSKALGKDQQPPVIQ